MAWTSSPSSRLALEEATPADSAEILEILESSPLPGPASLVYTRRPDAYRSLQREGDPVGIIVARDRQHCRVVAMGAFAVRQLLVDGAATPVAYLFGLRARGDALRRSPVLHRGYAMVGDRLRALGVRHAITTIVESNRRVAAMLGRPRRSMPTYRSLGRYDVFALRPRRNPRTRPAGVRRAGAGDVGRIAEFLSETGRGQRFFPVIRVDDLLAGRGLPSIDSFHWLEGRPGEVLAVAALWDQAAYRQYRIHRLGRTLAGLRLLAGLAPFLPLPRLPAPGEELRHATLALWAARGNDPTLLGDLLAGMAAPASAYPFVLAGAHAGHPLHGMFRGRSLVPYRSEVFQVVWGPDPPPSCGGPVYLECGTL